MLNQKSNNGAVDSTLTYLRVTVGVITAAHGWQKLQNLESWQEQLASLGIPMPQLSGYLAIAGELLGGVGLILGLLTPVAAFGVASVLLVAIAAVHLPNGLFAENNGFELPLALMSVAIYFIARGGGPWSLDALLHRFRRSGEDLPQAQVRAPSRPDPVTEAGMESFPASDPPSFTPEKST